MGLVLVMKPAALPVERESVWGHLNATPLSAPDDSAFIDEIIAAAVERLDGPEGLLNRALITQQWRVEMPRFPSLIRIPLARCRQVDAIAYVDEAGENHSLDPASYVISGLHTDRCFVRPVAGTSWPESEVGNLEAVSVTFTSGFGDDAGDVPAPLRLAVMQMVAASYADREGAGQLPPAAISAVTDWSVFA